MTKFYLTFDNSGSSIIAHDTETNLWYHENCAPTGFWGDTDICIDSSDKDAIEKTLESLRHEDLSVEYMNGEFDESFRPKSIEEYNDICNADLTCDFVTSYFIAEV